MPIAALTSSTAIDPEPIDETRQVYARPAVCDAAERAYALVEPLAAEDPYTDWPILRLVGAMAVGDQPVWELANDPGAAQVLAPDVAPEPWLPVLAAMIGARLSGSMTTEDRRAELRSPSSRSRGSIDRMRAAVAPFMAEPRRMTVRDRWRASQPTADSPGYMQFRLRAADVLDEDKALDALIAAKPAGIVLDVVVTNDRTWSDAVATYSSWDTAVAGNTSWNDLIDED